MKECISCKRDKYPILLQENKIKHLLSENLLFHIDNKLPLYKTTSINIKTIKEARKLYSRNLIKLNESDESLVKSDIGYKGNYNEEEVPLDVPVKDGENPVDSITMDIPLFIRMLEYAREDAKADMDLHDVTEKAISLSKDGDILNMDNYEDIIGKTLKESYHMYHRNPSTKQINKFIFSIYECSKRDTIHKLIKEALSFK